MEKILGETHSFNPPYRRQSTSHSASARSQESQVVENESDTFTTDFRFNNNDHLSPLPVSMTELLREVDEDESSHSVDGFLEERSQRSQSIESSPDDFAVPSVSTTQSTIRRHIKRPTVVEAPSSQSASKVHRLSRTKKSTTTELDGAWETQSARDHEVSMARIELEKKRIVQEDKRLELDKERADRREKIEEE